MKAKHMPGEHADKDVSSIGERHIVPRVPIVPPQSDTTNCFPTTPRKHKESNLAGLALLLGPETDYTTRARAARRLARQGPALLPLLLKTLNNYPEITSPPWPWWPPQYEHIARLLIYFCRSMQVPVQRLLEDPTLTQPIGPVLYISVIEAASASPFPGYESLLSEGLQAPWKTVRYAAAMALAKLAGQGSLHETSVDVLHSHQCETEDLPVRLAVACALLRNGEGCGIETLMNLLRADVPEEARKGAVFVLATESSALIASPQRERLMQLLLLTLQDQNTEIALHAVHALREVASPSILPALRSLLASPRPTVQLAALAALEEVASRKAMRRAIQHYKLPAQVIPLLQTRMPELRRQACFTLAAFGGAYSAAVLGTILLEHAHPANIEAIEALRLLAGVLRNPTRTNVLRWLLSALHQPQEEIQITALESLSYLLWEAKRHSQKKAVHEISEEVVSEGTVAQLLAHPDSWVRQRAIELVSMLDSQPDSLRLHLISLLHYDPDSEVRACTAHSLGQTGARWAIPALLRALLDSDDQVIRVALHSLGVLVSPNDPIVVYVLKELTCYSQTGANKRDCIGQQVQTLLKKWRKATGTTVALLQS